MAKIKQAPKARETVYKDSLLAEAYSYDGQGNRVEETNVLRGVSRTYTYDDEDKIVWAVVDPEPVEGGLDAYMYDVDGFLTSRSITSGIYSGAATFDYSSRGELLTASLPTGDTITYQHDPMGRRISKSVNGVVVEKYLWQDATTLLAVLDAAGTVVQRFEYADGRMPVAMVASGAVYYLAYDQVGSLRVVTDAVGTVVKQIDYDSFGNILNDSNPAFTVPFGFAGGLQDRDTSLVRFGARDYDPTTGKWTAKDPIDFEGGDLNLLNYCLGDPINWVDFNGKQPIDFPCEFYDFKSTIGMSFTVAGHVFGFDNTGPYHALNATTAFGISVLDWTMDEMGDYEIIYGESSHLGVGVQMKGGKVVGSSIHLGFALGTQVSVTKPHELGGINLENYLIEPDMGLL